MIDVARLGHADDRVDQQAAADLLGGSLGQLFVSPVQRVAGLEGDDPAPAQRLEVLAQLGRRAAQLDEIVVRRDADHLEPARRIMARQPVEIGDRGMRRVERAIGVPGFVVLVVGVDLLDVQERQQVAVDVAQGQRLAFGDAVAGRDRQRHRQAARACRRPAASRRRPARSRPCPGSSSAAKSRRRPAARGRTGRARRASGWRSPWRSPSSRRLVRR